MKSIKIALLGYGNAGRAFCELLAEKSGEIEKGYDCRISITAISTKTKGTVTDPGGIDMVSENRAIRETGRFSEDKAMSALDVAMQADYDILFELTPLDIFSGQPAISHIEAALKRGKHVVSANKGPIDWDFKRLKELAETNKCRFYYETTVMDGTPIFNLYDETLKMCKVNGIRGILNSTTNYILDEMAKGTEYKEIMKEGERRGFVEADPSLDIEGWDAAAKLTALMNILMDIDITPKDIVRIGIEDVTYVEVKKAEASGKKIKLMCYTEADGEGRVTGHVEPIAIPKDDMYATISGTTSAVSITTDLMGTVTVIEHDPEIEQTAYGIFGDLLRVLSNI